MLQMACEMCERQPVEDTAIHSLLIHCMLKAAAVLKVVVSSPSLTCAQHSTQSLSHTGHSAGRQDSENHGESSGIRFYACAGVCMCVCVRACVYACVHVHVSGHPLAVNLEGASTGGLGGLPPQPNTTVGQPGVLTG